MKNKILSLFAIVVFANLLVTCNNYLHELIPPDDNRILSFEVDGQIMPEEIENDTITVIVGKETDITSVIPRITVSKKADIIPVTLKYFSKIFPNVNLLETAIQIYTTDDITSYVKDLIRNTPGFNFPEIDIPIDFSGPVTFLVMSGQGTTRQYTVNVIVDSGEPKLLSLNFTKYNNPELMKDANSYINEKLGIIAANAVYPDEIDDLTFKLIPNFEIIGDSLKIDGVEIISGDTEVLFGRGLVNKEITVYRDGETKTYRLNLMSSIDPDTNRSITDFRFTKEDNPLIAVNSVATIINFGDTGTITMQVYYSGSKPNMLTPRIIAPGRVSVGGILQNKNSPDGQDFSDNIVYRVVSVNGMYAREYTVKVDFVNLTENAPRITSFKFSQVLNPELVQDTFAQISDSVIMIDAYYGSLSAPIFLNPEFSAEGIVTVSGSVQVSGLSPQAFSNQVKYTVTNPENPMYTRDYWVQCRMIQDISSNAVISSFGFYVDNNNGLDEDLIAKIDQNAGKISIIAPVGSGVTTRMMYPKYECVGQVSVGGIIQSSEETGFIFNMPITYTVVSANGRNTREYIVEVRELRPRMFVNCNAVGMGDGTSWENAFLSVKFACEAAALFHDNVDKEIWIAAGTYTPGENREDYFTLTPNTSYIGGFAGWESSKDQRNTQANVTIISGDLGAGRYSFNLFANPFNAISGNPFMSEKAIPIDGDLIFENLVFTDARAIREWEGAGGSYTVNGTSLRGNKGAGILAELSLKGSITVKGCTFKNLELGAVHVIGYGSYHGGAAIFVYEGNAYIYDTSFYSCNQIYESDVEYDEIYVYPHSFGTLCLNVNGEITLQRISVEDSTSGLYLESNDNITVTDLNLQNIMGTGLRVSGRAISENQVVTANHVFSGIKAYNVNYGNDYEGAVNIVRGSGFTLQNSVFESCNEIKLTTQRRHINVLNTQILNSNGNAWSEGALKITCGGTLNNLSATAAIHQLTIDGIGEGNGIYFYLNGTSTAQLYNSVIKNRTSTGTSRAGIYVSANSNSSVIEIANTRMENIAQDVSPRAIYVSGGILRLGLNNHYNNDILDTQSKVNNLITAGNLVLTGTTRLEFL